MNSLGQKCSAAHVPAYARMWHRNRETGACVDAWSWAQALKVGRKTCGLSNLINTSAQMPLTSDHVVAVQKEDLSFRVTAT